MRVIVKLFLLAVVAVIMCFCYKFIMISGGIKTVLSEANREFDSYSATKQLAIVADIEEVYTYKAFGKRFYIIETDSYGLIMRTTDVDGDDEDALIEILDSAGLIKSVSVPHWAIFLAAGIIIIIFPRFRKKKAKK